MAPAPPHGRTATGAGPRRVRLMGWKGTRRVMILFNPLSTTPGKQPLPLSLMSLAAMLESQSIPWTLVDGNIVSDPAQTIIGRLANSGEPADALLAVTVMPGPQLTQAVAVCRQVKAALPHVSIVWGGYFPTQH